MLSEKNSKKKILESKKMEITWGNQIRSYVFDEDYVKDVKTGIKKNNVSYVLDGNLEDFLKR